MDLNRMKKHTSVPIKTHGVTGCLAHTEPAERGDFSLRIFCPSGAMDYDNSMVFGIRQSSMTYGGQRICLPRRGKI